jgi:hypothetical protein
VICFLLTPIAVQALLSNLFIGHEKPRCGIYSES